MWFWRAPGRAVWSRQDQGCVGGPLGMQMGSSAPPPLAGCVRACVRTLASIPALLSSLKICICKKP